MYIVITLSASGLVFLRTQPKPANYFPSQSTVLFGQFFSSVLVRSSVHLFYFTDLTRSSCFLVFSTFLDPLL